MELYATAFDAVGRWIGWKALPASTARIFWPAAAQYRVPLTLRREAYEIRRRSRSAIRPWCRWPAAVARLAALA